MSEDRQKVAVTVRIGGEDHVIRSNADPDYTRRCANWVDERIAEVKRHLGLIESHKAAILAALSISDELFQAQQALETLQGEVLRRTEELARRVEGLAPPPPPEQGELLPPDPGS